MVVPTLPVSKVSGMMGFPASSFTAEMLTAHKMDAMLMKSEALAMLRPRQIL